MKKYLLILFLLIPCLIWAGTSGKLTGKVTDKSTKEPLPFVNVIVEGTNLGAATDIDGNYVILNIPPGKYSVRVQYIGYQTQIMENVSISVDLTTMRDFELSQAAVELNAIVIQGTTERVQKDITSSQSSISTEQISNLPVAELEDVVRLQAGVTTDASGGFHIRGGRTTEIAYWVNGISITDPFDNSQGIRIDNSSVQELQVISGTFNAEYGNAMSGIVNTVTKEGGMKYTGNIQVYSSDNVSNFTEYFPHIDNYNPFASYNLQGSLSGPIPFTNDQVKFFASIRHSYDDGYLMGERRYTMTGEKSDGKVVSMNWNKRFVGQGNLSYWITKDVKLNDEFLYSKENGKSGDDGWYTYLWEPDGWPNYTTNSYINTFSLTHMLSSSTYYTLKGAYFFKDVNTKLYDSATDPRYLHPDSLNILNYSFRTKGTNLHRYFRETTTLSGRLDFTSQVNLNHLIKFGAEFKSYDLQLDDYNLIPLEIDNMEVTPFVPDIPGEDSPTRTKYEYKPIEFSTYLQDKIEYQNVIINVGLRFDYFDANGKVLVDQSDPNIYVALRSGMKNLSIAEREQYYYKNSKPKWQVSPRFGIAYPISAAGVVHFSYGHFLQIPNFDYLYKNGQYHVPESGSNYYGPYGNPDLEPQQTVMYEIGFRQEFFGDFLADVTGFYRDVRNWITAGPLLYTSNLVPYSIYVNKDYANVKGITLTLSKKFANYYSLDINYTYQVADGSNSSPEDEFNAAKNNNEPAIFLIPMDWDQRHLLNTNLYIGGESWGASLTARYGTGLPYSPSVTQYTSDRGISSALQRNSRRRPNQFTIDFKVDKSFELIGTKITTFVRVFNLLDSKVAVNVFGDSGKPDFTTEAQNIGEDSSRPNTVAEYLRYPWNYGEPRSVQTGIEIAF